MKLAPLPSLWSRSQIGRLREQGSPEHTTRSAAHTQAGASSQRDAVTLVDLRPMRNVRTAVEPEAEGRRLTTRHVVRGHWTHQPHGPGRQLRRLQWIASYTRGPDGAPLVERDTVYIWRR